ncbi:MAG: hypothetical protein ACRC8S_02410 [Fimbriiglobus sp.]
MGVSLLYQTSAPVTAKVKAAILSEAERINSDRRWWCEGFIFFDPRGRKKKGPAPLTGDTKLFYSFGGYTHDGEFVEVDGDVDDFMGFRDAAFIVRQLVHWSREYGVAWSLEMAGAELGTVAAGATQPPGLLGWDTPESRAEKRRATTLDSRYASRWE